MAPKAKKIAKADKPKKKLSGYMKFAKERRPSLLKEKPNLSFGEVRAPSPLARAPDPRERSHPKDAFTHRAHTAPRSQVGKTMGAEWRKMSDAQKAKYK